MTTIKAGVLVDGEEEILVDQYFQCRDGLIPHIRQKLYRKHHEGHELEVSRDLTFELGTSNPRVIKWDEMLGINATSPLASPFLLRFYIGRVRNGYQYRKLEDALRRTSDEGIELPDMVTAWNLRGDPYFNALGLANILPTVRGGWDYGKVNYARIFPPSRFI